MKPKGAIERWCSAVGTLAALHFCRPENIELHRKWEYKRVNDVLTNAARADLEKQSWSFLGNRMGAFHYSKREVRPGLHTN
jgi:hypothetical protein